MRQLRRSPRSGVSHSWAPRKTSPSWRREGEGESRECRSRAPCSLLSAWLGNGSVLRDPHLEGTWSRGAANSCWSSSDPCVSCWFSISTSLPGWSISAPRTGISRRKTRGTSSRLRTPTTLRNTTSPWGTWRGRSISKSRGRTWSCFCTSRRRGGLPSGGTWSRMSAWRSPATADRARRSVPATGRTARRPGSSPGSPPAGAAACTPTGPSSPTVCRGSSTRRRTSRRTRGRNTNQRFDSRVRQECEVVTCR